MSSITTEVLATWRELERALGRLRPDDERAATIAQRIDELRGLYRQLTDTSAQPQVTPAGHVPSSGVTAIRVGLGTTLVAQLAMSNSASGASSGTGASMRAIDSALK